VKYVKLRRVNGRVVAEDRPLPVAEFLVNAPDSVLEIRKRPRLVLKPADDGGGQRRQVNAILTPTLRPGTPASSLPPADTTTVFIDRVGNFTLPLDDGLYRAAFEGLPFGYYVKSLTIGSRDILREPFRADNASQEIVVTVTQKAPDGIPAGVKVTGRIRENLARLRLWAFLTADDPENGRAGAVQPSADGAYQFLNVPPGKYTLKIANDGMIPIGITWTAPPVRSVVVGNQDIQIE
jgi:hypothetical protein